MKDSDYLIIIKSVSIVVMFTIALVMARLPLKAEIFRTNKIVLSMSAAFSGGLFLAIGLLHLLPESNLKYEEYLLTIDWTGEPFPLPFLITILSFSVILFIEKIATNHTHAHKDHKDVIDESIDRKIKNAPLIKNNGLCCEKAEVCCYQVESIEAEETLKKAVSSTVKMAQRVSFSQKKRLTVEKNSNLAPFLLQVAISIHALFEGMAIGLQSEVAKCLGISLAVLCHKWAEGLTLGLAFKQSKVKYQTALIMIMISASMNPIGIGIGWIIATEGNLIVMIFYSISAGTFLYIATIEVIVEEFNIARHKALKFMLYLVAIAFVTGVWFLEQLDI